jgi:hypothetical protein
MQVMVCTPHFAKTLRSCQSVGGEHGRIRASISSTTGEVAHVIMDMTL